MILVMFKSDEPMWCGAYLDSRCQKVKHRFIESVEFAWPVEDKSSQCKGFLEFDKRLENPTFRKTRGYKQDIMATSGISESIDLEVRCREMTSVLRAAVRTRLDIRVGRKSMVAT